MKKWLLQSAGRAQAKAPRPFSIARVGKEVEVTYQIAYSNTRPVHRPVYRAFRLPGSFYDARRHIFEADPPVSNHDPLAFYLFSRLLDEVPTDPVNVLEFGVWNGAFLENLAIHATETKRKLVIWAFDTFDTFPDMAEAVDLRSRPIEDYRHAIILHRPATVASVKERLEKYPSVTAIEAVTGEIIAIPSRRLPCEFVHYDMDFYSSFFAAMNWVQDVRGATMIVDDYYQPSWPGMVDAVNEFCAKHDLYPLNLSDYYRMERSLRTQWIAVLKALRGNG